MAYEATVAECWAGTYRSCRKRSTLHFTVSCKR